MGIFNFFENLFQEQVSEREKVIVKVKPFPDTSIDEFLSIPENRRLLENTNTFTFSWDKPEPQISNIQITYDKNKSMKNIIEEIHNSFLQEQDFILQDCQNEIVLLKKQKDILEKAEKLKKVGFVNSSEVHGNTIDEINKGIKENEHKQKIKKALNYFGFKYPNYKFITVNSVEKICKKYGLIYSESINYIKDIPDKNLSDILKANIKIEDCYVYFEFQFHGLKDGSINYKFFMDYWYRKYKDRFNEKDAFFRKSLEIVAPPSYFNLKNKRIVNHQLVDIQDPIVLQPVWFEDAKYYLIITMWGDENLPNPHSEPDLNNERFN